MLTGGFREIHLQVFPDVHFSKFRFFKPSSWCFKSMVGIFKRVMEQERLFLTRGLNMENDTGLSSES